MRLEFQFALSVVICYFLFVVFFTALRDIIQFRFQWSIFDKIKIKWLRDYLLDQNPKAPRAFDGWHQSDGGGGLIPTGIIFLLGKSAVLPDSMVAGGYRPIPGFLVVLCGVQSIVPPFIDEEGI